MTASSQSTPPDTIVLIHGLWMTPRSWEHWKERYESRGYRVLAPAWPGLEAEVEALRADPTPLTKLNARQVIDHYDGIIRGLDAPPIIMGHSLGGAITQVLLDRGLGAAGVGVASATTKGVRDLPLSTLKATRHILGRPFNRGNATPSNRKQFQYAFEEDHIVPPKASRHNAEKYKRGTVAFTSFPGRPHFPGAPGWEEVADYALSWAVEHAGTRQEAPPVSA